MRERHQIIVKLLLSHILPLIGLLFFSFIFNHDGFLLITITQTILLIVFLAGYWEFFGLKFKWIFCSTLEILLLVLFINRILFENTELPETFWFTLLAITQLYLLWLLSKIIRVIFKIDKEKIEISFPFENGFYLVTDGGNSKICRMMNYHFHSQVHKTKNTNKSMLYATDIVKLKNKKISFIPTTREEYPIFNEDVFSPIEGLIVKVINDIEDNEAFSGNYPYNTGNTVVIKKDNYYFLLGHLKKGSIKVKVGENVKRKTLVGKAGNSGMSERPHLHMQLIHSETDDYWKGMGICITYNSKNLFKNRLIKIYKTEIEIHPHK